MAKKSIHQWGPRSLALEVPATIDDRCPFDQGVVLYDDTNKRDECESCGQPIRARKATPLPRYTLYD